MVARAENTHRRGGDDDSKWQQEATGEVCVDKKKYKGDNNMMRNILIENLRDTQRTRKRQHDGILKEQGENNMMKKI